MAHYMVSTGCSSLFLTEDVDVANKTIATGVAEYCFASAASAEQRLFIGVAQTASAKVDWLCAGTSGWDVGEAVRAANVRLVKEGDARGVPRPGEEALQAALAAVLTDVRARTDPSEGGRGGTAGVGQRTTLVSLLLYDAMPSASAGVVEAVAALLRSDAGTSTAHVHVEVLLVQCAPSDGGLPSTRPPPGGDGDDSMGRGGEEGGALGGVRPMPSVQERWQGGVPGGDRPHTLASAERFTKAAAALERSLRRLVEVQLTSGGGGPRHGASRLHVRWLPNTPAGWLASSTHWMRVFAAWTPCALAVQVACAAAGVRGGKGAPPLPDLPLRLMVRATAVPAVRVGAGARGLPHTLVLHNRVPLEQLPLQLLLDGPVAVQGGVEGEGEGEGGSVAPSSPSSWTALLALLDETDTALLLQGQYGRPSSPLDEEGVDMAGAAQGGTRWYLLLSTRTGGGGGGGGAGAGGGSAAAPPPPHAHDYPDAVLYRVAGREEALVHGLHCVVRGRAQGEEAAALQDDSAQVARVLSLLASARTGVPSLPADGSAAADGKGGEGEGERWAIQVASLPSLVYDPLAHPSGAFEAGLAAHKKAVQQHARQAEEQARAEAAAAKKTEQAAARAASRKATAVSKQAPPAAAVTKVGSGRQGQGAPLAPQQGGGPLLVTAPGKPSTGAGAVRLIARPPAVPSAGPASSRGATRAGSGGTGAALARPSMPSQPRPHGKLTVQAAQPDAAGKTAPHTLYDMDSDSDLSSSGAFEGPTAPPPPPLGSHPGQVTARRVGAGAQAPPPPAAPPSSRGIICDTDEEEEEVARPPQRGGGRGAHQPGAPALPVTSVRTAKVALPPPPPQAQTSGAAPPSTRGRTGPSPRGAKDAMDVEAAPASPEEEVFSLSQLLPGVGRVAGGGGRPPRALNQEADDGVPLLGSAAAELLANFDPAVFSAGAATVAPVRRGPTRTGERGGGTRQHGASPPPGAPPGAQVLSRGFGQPGREVDTNVSLGSALPGWAQRIAATADAGTGALAAIHTLTAPSEVVRADVARAAKARGQAAKQVADELAKRDAVAVEDVSVFIGGLKAPARVGPVGGKTVILAAQPAATARPPGTAGASRADAAATHSAFDFDEDTL